ncbi:MAG: glycosyltransferase WbuB [Acidimicrobiales bacterium mtb01]|nr:glycosyltransferase family 4 protein [Actinomycetota bacterium]TEX45635.1 MAG: glycosyltransferase WbuB [Acidimicrobiales bacterium mtb01]
MRIVVVCPHFEPDTAPTGVVMTRIVDELAALGHQVHVVSTLPWYAKHRVEESWAATTWRTRTQQCEWGSITRLDPFAGSDKRNLVRRALGFIGFSVTAAVAGCRVARRQKIDAVFAMSPPLTLGVTGWVIAKVRRVRLVVNIQDVFPDAAVETGAIRNRAVIAAARVLEKWVYRRASAVTVLSDDLADNLRAKVPSGHRDRIVVIPNFVDTDAITPLDRRTEYRRELGLDDRPVVMYAGNVGFSQSLELLLAAARRNSDVWFVVNGEGSARYSLEDSARDLANVRFADYQPVARLPEVLATADLHVIPLKRGLGRVSVPSKTYSIMAAGRPALAAIDPDTEVPRLLARSGGGVSVDPDDVDAFCAALSELLGDPARLIDMGHKARAHVLGNVSPRAVGEAYAEVLAGHSRDRHDRPDDPLNTGSPR